MNDTHIDDRELDRLADGELSPAAMRDLFTRLDRTDDGWRRAALVLLEAQALRSACRDVLIPSVPTTSCAPASAGPAGRSGQRELLAVAAAILVTLGAGWWAFPPLGKTAPASDPVADHRPERPAADPVTPVSAVQMSFANADGGWSDPVTMPVLDAANPTAQAWLTMRPTIPDIVRERLAAEGQQVHEQQTWVPVELADGRVGVVPVTDVVVAPTSLRDYQ